MGNKLPNSYFITSNEYIQTYPLKKQLNIVLNSMKVQTLKLTEEKKSELTAFISIQTNIKTEVEEFPTSHTEY